MSQKRVAIGLVMLVGAMTLSAGTLLLMENGASGFNSAPSALAYSDDSIRTMVDNNGHLQTQQWNFIIIYESGDMAGSAASLADGRVEGVSPASEASLAVRRPANFHFVVGNGHAGRSAQDGEVEVGSSWVKQDIGTPVVGWPETIIRNNKDYNYLNAVGVCVIGDGSQAPSSAQIDSLQLLVQELRIQCHIPADGVKFSWELPPNERYATPAQKAFAAQFRRLMN